MFCNPLLAVIVNPLFFIFIGNLLSQHMGVLQASSMGWNGAPAVAGIPVVKKLVRLDVPVDKYPNVCVAFFYVFLLLFPQNAIQFHECFVLWLLPVQLCWSFAGTARQLPEKS
jgi:hypothetical protein